MKPKELYYEIHHEEQEEILLFIHGFASSSWPWWQQVDHFKNYQIILIDLPGHGNSAHIKWENLKEVSQLVADIIPPGKKVHLIGISLGGHVALEAARFHVDKLASVFISGITVVPMGPKLLSHALPLYLHFFKKGQENTSKLREMAREYNLPNDKIKPFIEDYQKVEKQIAQNIFKELYSFKMDEKYANIKLPIIFVACENEEKGIQATLQQAPKVIKQAETALIPNAEHQWPMQQPEVFNHFLENWLANS